MFFWFVFKLGREREREREAEEKVLAACLIGPFDKYEMHYLMCDAKELPFKKDKIEFFFNLLKIKLAKILQDLAESEPKACPKHQRERRTDIS